jgi:hypothetical protein
MGEQCLGVAAAKVLRQRPSLTLVDDLVVDDGHLVARPFEGTHELQQPVAVKMAEATLPDDSDQFCKAAGEHLHGALHRGVVTAVPRSDLPRARS